MMFKYGILFFYPYICVLPKIRKKKGCDVTNDNPQILTKPIYKSFFMREKQLRYKWKSRYQSKKWSILKTVASIGYNFLIYLNNFNSTQTKSN